MSHFILYRAEYEALRKQLEDMDPFLTISQHDFSNKATNDIMNNSKRVAIDRELRLINSRLERAARAVDDTERVLAIEKRWERFDTEYRKILEYIDNKKFVRTVEELQGLVVSRLMELDKVNLSGSGMCFHLLRSVSNFFFFLQRLQAAQTHCASIVSPLRCNSQCN